MESPDYPNKKKKVKWVKWLDIKTNLFEEGS